MKVYLVVLSSKLDRPQVIEYLSSQPKMGMWFYSTPSSFFIKSDLSATELSRLIKEKFGRIRHFVTEVNLANRAGLMPKNHWELMEE